jgi:nitroreductase
MEFKRVVLKRRMVRHFRNEPVSPEVINRIMTLALHAPSAGFSQGFAFVVVAERETRAELGRLQGEEGYAQAGFHRWVSEAPVDIVACVSEKLYHDRYREPDKLREDGTEIEWPTPYWFFDIGCACMIALLAAVDEGLAAAFTGVSNVAGVRELLGIPEHFHPVGVISIGHPDKDVRSPSLKRGRRPFEEVVHFEHW